MCRKLALAGSVVYREGVPIVVQKYGGSSVADVDKLGRVADKVLATRAEGHDVVVVVSAMGKTTDELLGLARQVDESPPRRELDMLVSTGERITMALLSMAIQKRGADAISFTGSQSGIITNDRHFDARIIDVRPHRIEDELARGKVVIIAGFQGMSYKREITTLGRGGSDTTALAMAAALGAAHAEIYSDVDGVYSADPRVVPNAMHLAELSYDEMQEMAEAGAKVLHAAAVEFARRSGITIRARSTFSDSGRETCVRDGPVSEAARAVVGRKNLARISGLPGTTADQLAALSEAGLEPRMSRSTDTGTIAFVDASIPDWTARVKKLPAGTEVVEGHAAVTAIGRGSSLAAPFSKVLEAHRFEIQQLEVAPLQVAAVLKEADVDAAVRALHDALVAR